MRILSHRGYWLEDCEKNTAKAFKRSFDLCFGTETDLRDSLSKIVISHDMPSGDEMRFEDFLDIMGGRNLPLALNIKADGLAEEISSILSKYNHTNYFTFDMSVPDLRMHLSRGLKVFTGISDIQPLAPLLEQSEGVWLDSFNSDWFNAALIDTIIESGKKLCIVSSELHKRCPDEQWKIIAKAKNLNSENLMICTDKPQIAQEFFNAKN